MKKFLVKVFILLIPLIVGIVLPLPENSYDLAIIDKHRILADTESPKIVLAGGSNLAFGIDSAEIKNKLNFPVVNTAVHAGFGLGRMLDDISRYLYTGDILLIIPEYSHFTGAWNGDSAAYELIFDAHQYRLLWSSYYGMPNDFSSYISTHLNAIIPRGQNPLAYSRDGFNEYGDYVKHLGMENRPFVSDKSAGTLNQSYLNNFFRFIDNFTERGITVMLSYPCYEEQSFRNSAALIQELDVSFRAKENLLVISTPEAYCYPAEYFYDTVYHLNREGRAVRTSQLILDLQESGFPPIDETLR